MEYLEILREAMNNRKINQLTLANLIGVHKEEMSLILNGKRTISIDIAIKLEDALGVNAEKLLIKQLKNDLNSKRMAVEIFKEIKIKNGLLGCLKIIGFENEDKKTKMEDLLNALKEPMSYTKYSFENGGAKYFFLGEIIYAYYPFEDSSFIGISEYTLSILRTFSLIRYNVLKKLGLEVSCCITYGELVYNDDKNLVLTGDAFNKVKDLFKKVIEEPTIKTGLFLIDKCLNYEYKGEDAILPKGNIFDISMNRKEVNEFTSDREFLVYNPIFECIKYKIGFDLKMSQKKKINIASEYLEYERNKLKEIETKYPYPYLNLAQSKNNIYKCEKDLKGAVKYF